MLLTWRLGRAKKAQEEAVQELDALMAEYRQHPLANAGSPYYTYKLYDAHTKCRLTDDNLQRLKSKFM